MGVPAALIAAAGFASAAHAHCGRRACALVGASVFLAGLVLPFVLLAVILSFRGVATRDSIAGHGLVTVIVMGTLLALDPRLRRRDSGTPVEGATSPPLT